MEKRIEFVEREGCEMATYEKADMEILELRCEDIVRTSDKLGVFEEGDDQEGSLDGLSY